VEIKLQAFYLYFATRYESPLHFCCSSSWKGTPGIHQIGGSMGSSVIGLKTAVRAWTVRGSNPPYSKRIFSSQKRTDRLRGPPSLLFGAYRGSFPGVKRPRPEVNYSPPSSSEVKNEWIYTSSPLYAFMAWTGKTLPFLGGSLNPTVDPDVDRQRNP